MRITGREWVEAGHNLMRPDICRRARDIGFDYALVYSGGIKSGRDALPTGRLATRCRSPMPSRKAKRLRCRQSECRRTATRRSDRCRGPRKRRLWRAAFSTTALGLACCPPRSEPMRLPARSNLRGGGPPGTWRALRWLDLDRRRSAAKIRTTRGRTAGSAAQCRSR